MPHKHTRGEKEDTSVQFSALRNESVFRSPVSSSMGLIACLLGIGLLTGSCGSLPKESAEAQSQRGGGGEKGNRATTVDVAIARTELLRQQPEYTGTTVPFRSVSLRSQAEGQLLALNVDVGYAVKKGQIIGQLDDDLLRVALNQAEAELAARKSEVARARTQVSNARAEVERLRLVVVQAQADSQRQQQLLKEGAIAAQIAQQGRTESLTAAQALRAASAAVRTEQQAVAAAQGRVVAQEAVVAEAKERRSYAKLTSPIAGLVTEKMTEPGNLLQPGNEVLRIGDFSRAKVQVQVSEKELATIQVGQSVEVSLDAFPNQKYTGKVTRISPAADATARLVPVEVEIPNIDGKIGSGLLARVNFQNTAQQRVVIPQTAIQAKESETRPPQNAQTQRRGGVSPPSTEKNSPPSTDRNSPSQNPNGTVFVITNTDGKPKVTARSVTLGERADNKVEILSGLKAGESYVVRSDKPLKDKQAVGISVISEKPQSTSQGVQN